MIKKSYLFFLLSLGSSYAYALPSDCIEASADGTVSCFPAKSTFLGAANARFDNFEDALASMGPATCAIHAPNGVCYLQYLNDPPDPVGRNCGSIASSCSDYSHMNYDTWSNDAGRFTITYYDHLPDPYYKDYFYRYGGFMYHYRNCPANTTSVALGSNTYKQLCKPIDTSKPSPCPTCDAKKNGSATVGDPIDIGSGTKTVTETDYTYNSYHPFVFRRYYNHVNKAWRNEFDRTVAYTGYSGNEFLTFSRHNFVSVTFKKINNEWFEFSGGQVLNTVANTANAGFSFTMDTSNNITLTTANGETETYLSGTSQPLSNANNSSFKLSQIKKSSGYTLSFSYGNVTTTKVVDSYGHEFFLNYSTSLSGCSSYPTLVSISGMGNKTVNYEYTSCALSKVIYPDTTFKQYAYGSYGLVTIKDENNNIFETATYANYSGKGVKGTSEGLGLNGAIEKISLNYATANQVTLTDARANQVTVGFTKDSSNNFKINSYSSICSWCDGIQGSSITYYASGLIDTVTDFRGNKTKYTWNNQSNIATITQALGTSLEKTTTNTYDASGVYMATSTTPVAGGNKIATYTYNSAKQPIKLELAAPNGLGGTTTKEYNLGYDALGQVNLIKGAKYSSSFNDKMDIVYNSDGQISTVTNGLSQTITFNEYNDYGLPTKITAPNGNVNLVTYDLRGRMLTSTFKSSNTATDGETTTYQYDYAGLLTKLIMPAGNSMVMSYDTAHRLNKVQEYSEPDSTNPNGIYQGKVEFTLDNMSNLTAVKIFDSSNVQIRTSSAQYDNKNRLYKTIGSLNQTDTYTYDANSNLTQVTDAGNFVFSTVYDALDRVQSLTNPDNGSVSFTYTVDDDIATVTDAKGLVTTYNYDGFGNLVSLMSPDTGTTTYSYDLNNNLVGKTDARSQVVSYAYDVLNRLTGITYTASQYNNNSSQENVSLSYDSCMVGRLCQMNDQSGQTDYTYNSKGRLATKTQLISANSRITNSLSLTTTTSYSYNQYGQLSSVTYPTVSAHTGVALNYGYFNGKVAHIGMNNQDYIINNIVHEPLGSGLKSFQWGNLAATTSQHTNTYSQDGALTAITNSQTGSYNKGYEYDSRFNITKISSSDKTLDTTYDNKSRLSTYGSKTLPGNVTISQGSYSYNTSDDRTVNVKDSVTENYTYPSTSHRLSSLSGGKGFIYDNNGNMLEELNSSTPTVTFTYNASNRMKTSQTSTATTTYTYNAAGQRVKKEVVSGSNLVQTWFIYDASGVLMADYSVTNGVWNTLTVNEYVYLGSMPVAVIRDGVVYHIQTDQINTPRTITKATDNTLVWSWENDEPFGNNAPNENVSGNLFKFNLRFMGQYWDEEKNSSYNYFRDYDSRLGRYIQSDPIGLAGGFNIYGYVGGNPLGFIDPLGLKKVTNNSCMALLKMAEYEDEHGSIYPKYNPFNFSRDVTELNADFESVGGKVDLDWMARGSAPIIGPAFYYIGKVGWNIMNAVLDTTPDIIEGKRKFSLKLYNPLMGMSSEGHFNAPLGSMYYWLNPHVSIRVMFSDAIQKCQCMVGNNRVYDSLD